MTADDDPSDTDPTTGEDEQPIGGSEQVVGEDERPDSERLDEETGPNSERGADAGNDGGLRIDRERVVTYLRWGALFVLGIVILVAGGGLYSSLGAIIDVWVADRYQPIARAGLNFALLCGAVAGVVATLRRL